MAAPSYTTDLTTYKDMSTTTGISEATSMTATDGSGEVDTDLAIYSTECISESQRKSGLGSLVYTGTAPSWTSGWVYLVWYKFFAPNSLQTLANGGIRIVVGSTSANYYGFYMNGSDTYPYGGWENYAVDPEQTGLADQTQGTPTTTYNTVGFGASLITGISKGNSHTIDIIRYGRGEAIFTDGDLGNGYATFDGYALVNDDPTTGRFGLFQDQGASYLWKGLMSLGITATSVDMRDANVSISIEDTIKVGSSFNRIEINNASSRVDWDTVSFTALGTVSKGEFEVIDNADVNFDSCSFTGMSTFKFLSNSTINTSGWRECGLITQSSATFDQCLFTDSTSSATILSDDPSKISDSSFSSDGSNHALEIPTGATGTYSFLGNTFINYAGGTGGSTGNECIYNNTGGLVTLNIGGGGDTPSYRNGTGATTIINNNVSITYTGMPDLTEIRIYAAGTTTELAGIENATAGTAGDRTFTYSLSAGTDVDVRIFNKMYIVFELYGFTIPSSDSTIPVQLVFDRNYIA